jgi:hypothetical protein
MKLSLSAILEEGPTDSSKLANWSIVVTELY